MAEARRQTGVKHIDTVATGNGKTAGGFKWKYKN